MKLPIGQKNVIYTILKPGYALGAIRPTTRKAIKGESIANGIILRKAS
jgi:hypothetical protein